MNVKYIENTSRILVLFLLLVTLLFACNPSKSNFYWTIVRVGFYNEDNTGEKPVDAVSNSIPAKAYAIRISYLLVNTEHRNDISSNSDENNFYITNSPVGIAIYSLSDFDASHPALSSLNDCFYTLADTTSGYFVNPIVGQNGQIGPNVNFYGANTENDTFRTSAYLVLMRQPLYPGNRSFVINMTYADTTTSSDTLNVNLL